jgi:hypothetical protein
LQETRELKAVDMFDRRDTMSASVNFIGSMPWSGNPPLNTDDVPTPLVWPAAEPFAKESVCAATTRHCGRTIGARALADAEQSG